MAFGLDYSTGRPSHSAMKAAGVTFAVRYIGSSNHTSSRHPKFITPAEYNALKAAGFEVPLVFEQGPQRATGGRSAGLADAALTKAELAYLGLPPDYPVFYAVDFDAAYTTAIDNYFAAIGEARGVDQVGGYGGLKVIRGLFDKKRARLGWQTLAWSPSWDPRAQLRQTAINQTLDGCAVDHDESQQADYGQKPAGASPQPQEDDMPGRGVLQSRENVPNGYSELTLTVVNGTTTKIGLYDDHTFEDKDAGYLAQPPAVVRVVAHYQGNAGHLFTDTRADSPTKGTGWITLPTGKGWPDKLVLQLPAGVKADAWKVRRKDMGKQQVGADIS